ncbi:MAG: 23S rRNA (pseudouridine(1915)-N(3))-methyltransferase RlmH, partial [Pseudomonadota bacterium]
MKLLILAVGNKMPAWIETGFVEYAKRMPHEASIELLEIKPEKRGGGKKVEQLLTAEG